MKSLLLAGAIALSPLAALAQQPAAAADTGLSQPVIALTGALAKNADALALDDAQRADLKAWLAEMPAKRAALEAETVALRSQMRHKIAAGAPVPEREALAAQIGANETRLVMMRSHCADHWRSVLSPAQFAQLLQLAGVTD